MKTEGIMRLDKASKMPLYLQLKNLVKGMITSGELKPGCPMKTEAELCEEYGISRFPVRQALGELVEEGYLERTRGRGTFICEVLPLNIHVKKNKLLGLVANHLTEGFNRDILTGFEKQARRRGYLTAACSSEGSPQEEGAIIEKLIEAKVSGIIVFPCHDSKISYYMDSLKEKEIYIGLIDRNPGLYDIDYIGSDNFGGAYSAVRHLAIQGFKNVAFISDVPGISSVKERYEGYLKAVEDFNLKSLFCMTEENLNLEINEIRNKMPLGMFFINDFIAFKFIERIAGEDIKIGKDIGIVGFDNIRESGTTVIPLTTVAQNGFLLGHSAADIAIDKIEGITNKVHRLIIPTQLVVRNTCGEKGSL